MVVEKLGSSLYVLTIGRRVLYQVFTLFCEIWSTELSAHILNDFLWGETEKLLPAGGRSRFGTACSH